MAHNTDTTNFLSTEEIEESNKQQKKRYILTRIGVSLLLIVLIIIIISITTSVDDKSDTTNWKEMFLSIPNADNCRIYSNEFTSRPHLGATPDNYYYAQIFKQKLEEFGIKQVYIDNHTNDLYSRFVSASLTMNNLTGQFPFILSEMAFPEDPTSNTTLRHQAFLGYSNKGNVTGHLIYVNYASRKDFEALKSLNYSLNGSIGLARYGGGMFRGTKVYWAQTFGLIGLIIYSDPQQYVSEGRDVFPFNTSLPSTGFQRGTVVDTTCPGNLNTYRSESVCGKTLEETIPLIPAIPLSYGNALILFESMTGNSVLNASWIGDLNVEYRIGGNSDLIVNLFVDNILENATTSNVIGKIEGDQYKQESILIGGHRDAWIYGAADPISGHTSILEIARAFGEMVEKGFKPKRNIYFASWDGEEYNLIGSTNFAEREANMVQEELVGYINIDTSVSGFDLDLSSDQLLSQWIIDNTKEIQQPYTTNGETMYDLWSSKQSEETTRILGWESDHVSYVYHYGIPSVNMGFWGLNDCYHSIYDGYYWMSLLDKNWELAKGISLYAGLLLFDLATTDILPYNVSYLSQRMQFWFQNDIVNVGLEEQCDYQQLNPLAVDRMQESLDNFHVEATVFQAIIENVNENDDNYEDKVIEINGILRTLTSKFLLNDGLPQRIYFKNLLVGPDLDSGYIGIPYPYLMHSLKFNCTQSYIMQSFNTTANIIDIATQHLAQFSM